MIFSAVRSTHRQTLALSIFSCALFFLGGFSAEAQGRNQARDRAQAQGQERAQGRTQAQKPARQAVRGRAPRLLTVEQYSRLTSEQRQNYIGALQDLYIKVESQQMHRGRPMRYSAVDQNGEFHSGAGVNGGWPVGSEIITSFWAQVLGAPAWADNTPRCVIGGVIRPLNADRSCPTHPTEQRRCEIEGSGENTFKCGLIFKEVCVPRTVDGQIGSITQRCKQAFEELDAERQRVSEDDYERIKKVYERLLSQACENVSEEVCDTVEQRFNELQSQFDGGLPEDQTQSNRPTLQSEKPVCSGKSVQIELENSPFDFDSVEMEMGKVTFKKEEIEDVIHCDARNNEFGRSGTADKTKVTAGNPNLFNFDDRIYQLNSPKQRALNIEVPGNDQKSKLIVTCERNEIRVRFYKQETGTPDSLIGEYNIGRRHTAIQANQASLNFGGEESELIFKDCNPSSGDRSTTRSRGNQRGARGGRATQ